MDFKNLIEESWSSTTRFIGPVLLLTIVMIVLCMVSLGILTPVLTAGYMQSLLLAMRDKRQPEVGDLFSQMRLFLPLFFFSILVIAAIVIGFVLLILPGIAVIIFVSFAAFYLLPLMTDRGYGLVDGLKESWRLATKAPISDHLVTTVIYMVIMSLGGAVPFAFLVAQPLATSFLVAAYERRAEQQIPETDTGMTPPPPPPQPPAEPPQQPPVSEA